MIANSKGAAHAAYVFLNLLKNHIPAAFAALANEQSGLDFYQGLDFTALAPKIIKISEGPTEVIQPVHPALVFKIEGCSIDEPNMYNYEISLSYTIATPQNNKFIDITLLGCYYASEAILNAITAGIVGTGHGRFISGISFSELRQAQEPAPMYSRSVEINLTFSIEED